MISHFTTPGGQRTDLNAIKLRLDFIGQNYLIIIFKQLVINFNIDLFTYT